MSTATAKGGPGDQDRALSCTGVRAATRPWVGGKHFRSKIWMGKV